MSISERRQDLEVERSANSQAPYSIDFNPFYFKRSALREMIRWQMFSDDPKEFIIVGENYISLISPKLLKNARKHKGDERREFLHSLAEEMWNAERIILQVPSGL